MPAMPFPGSHHGVDPLDPKDGKDCYGGKVYHKALGDNAPVGERPDAGKARLAFEGATESYHTASRISVRYTQGAALMTSSYDLMMNAADEKQKFSDAVLNIRKLALQHPLLAGEIRDVLAPVFMICEDTDRVIGNAAGGGDFVDGKDVVDVKREGGIAAVVGKKRSADGQGEGPSSRDVYNPEAGGSKRTSQRRN